MPLWRYFTKNIASCQYPFPVNCIFWLLFLLSDFVINNKDTHEKCRECPKTKYIFHIFGSRAECLNVSFSLRDLGINI